MTFKKIGKFSTFALAIALAGCGGGSDAPTVTRSAEGVYVGALTGSTSSAFQLLVLEDGSYWSMYGTSTASNFLVRGFVQGSGTSTNGNFSSSNAKDFGFIPATSGSLTATYTNESTINGSLASTAGSIGFSGAAPVASTYIYANPAVVSSIAGSWLLSTLNSKP